MPEPKLLVFYLLLVALRIARMRSLLALPRYRGPTHFFAADLANDEAKRRDLERRYRFALLLSWFIVEALALADLVIFGEYDHIVLVQAPLTILLAVARRIVVRNFALRAIDLQPRPPTERRSFSLRPRRLATYTNVPFEIVNGLVLLVAIAVLVDQATSDYVFPVLTILYFEAGLLMRKMLVLRTPVSLPEKQSDEYLALADDALKAALNILDAVRGWITIALVLVAAKATWANSELLHSELFSRALVGFVVVFSIALAIHQLRVQRALLDRAKRVPSPVRPPPLGDPENLAFGGFLYKNADNPAIVVDGGPLRFAINVANRLTYVYIAYWAGLVGLIACATMHGAHH